MYLKHRILNDHKWKILSRQTYEKETWFGRIVTGGTAIFVQCEICGDTKLKKYT